MWWLLSKSLGVGIHKSWITSLIWPLQHSFKFYFTPRWFANHNDTAHITLGLLYDACKNIIDNILLKLKIGVIKIFVVLEAFVMFYMKEWLLEHSFSFYFTPRWCTNHSDTTHGTLYPIYDPCTNIIDNILAEIKVGLHWFSQIGPQGIQSHTCKYFQSTQNHCKP